MCYDDFIAKWCKWIECFAGEDAHSIRNQVRALVWNSAILRVAIKAIEIAPEETDGTKKVNGMIWNRFIAMGASEQSLAIRRLVDPASLEKHGKKDKSVYSFHALLSDMISNYSLITRHNVLKAEGKDLSPSIDDNAFSTHDDTRILHYCLSDSRNSFFDDLSGTSHGSREATDTIRQEFLEEQKDQLLGNCSIVKEHVDKFIAHASTPNSRAILALEEAKLTFGHIWNAEEACYKATTFLNGLLIDTSSNLLPIPQYDQFQYIENPIINKESVGLLREEWGRFNNQTESLCWEPFT